MIRFDVNDACLKEEIIRRQEAVSEIHRSLHEKSGAGNDYLGWLTWPAEYDRAEVDRIIALAERWHGRFDVLLVCGIGGSYLGARAAIEMIRGLYPEDGPEILYAGNTFSSDYMSQLLHHIKGKRILLNVISKSGTTTETALAFRILKQMMEETYGAEEAAGRIFATTDQRHGKLKEMADRLGYETFVIPDDIGGRYSVLTAVGLLPMAFAGVDIQAALAGMKDASVELNQERIAENTAYQYAVARRLMDEKGYAAELFVTYEPRLAMLAEWWKQLLGESEGKQGKGLLPDSVSYTTDLHSLGQFVQEGKKVLFETVLNVERPVKEPLVVPFDEENFDGMNYLAGKPLTWINEQAMKGTVEAHENTGGVPNLLLTIPDTGAYTFGYMAYWFFIAAAMSCYMLGINPFNQPGVEVYKKNMFRLLGKPGC